MKWIKSFMICLGLLLVAQVARARDIDSYTDNQGTLHISNIGPGKQENLAKPPSPDVPLHASTVPGPAPDGPPHETPPPVEQIPAPEPEAAPEEPAAPAPQPGARIITHADGGGVMPVAERHGSQARPPVSSGLVPVSYQPAAATPARQARPAARGQIAVHRDRQGVIHITNVSQDQAAPAAPASRGPAVVRGPALPVPPALPVLRPVAYTETAPAGVPEPALPAAPVRPAVRRVSCPELGAAAAEYIDAKLREPEPADVAEAGPAAPNGKTIERRRDRQGVWHIANRPVPAAAPPQPQVAVAAAPVTPAASPLPPAPGPGLAGEPLATLEPGLVVRRDQRGVMHISSRSQPVSQPGGQGPRDFPGKIPPTLQGAIMEASHRYRLPVSLIMAIIHKESNFVTQAVSPKGAMGLMQLMPGTATALGVQDPFAPRENILAGCRYFRYLLDYFQGSLPLALAGYNAGHQRVISAGLQVPAIKETQEFVTQVLGLYYCLEKRATSL
jgi:hypothetical protein